MTLSGYLSRKLDAEVIVVGGGPGGSTTAALLADAGHNVMLLDKAQFPRHKACSEYMNTGGVEVLRELGLLQDVLSEGAHQLAAMRVHSPAGDSFLADFERASNGKHAIGLSRYRLDALLLENARDSGATIIEKAHVRDVVTDAGAVTGVEAVIDGTRTTLSAKVVIGADGRHSAVSRHLGLDRLQRWPHRTGLVAHYRNVEGLDRFGEMHVVDWGYIGLAPLENGLTNVAVVLDCDDVTSREGDLQALFNDRLQSVAAVADRFRNATIEGSIRGVGPLARRVSRTAGDGYLLVGDAAGFLDPFTGDGIYEAMRGATLAAPVVSSALGRNDCSGTALKPYQTARRETFMFKRQVCWIVQGFLHQPRLMNYVTPRLSTRDDLGMTMSGVLGNLRPATQALSPVFLARLLRP